MINTTSINSNQTSAYENPIASTSNSSPIFRISTNILQAESSHVSAHPNLPCRPVKTTEPVHATQQEAKHGRQTPTAEALDDVLLHTDQLEWTQRLHQWQYAVDSENWEAVLDIIKNDIDAKLVNAAISAGRTALMQATWAQRNEIVAALIKVPGIHLNIADHNGNTALILAAYVGSTRITTMLHEADVNAVDMHGDSALLTAAIQNHLRVANILLQTPDIDPNLANIHRLTALHCAAQDNHHHMVRRLLKLNNINVNAVDEDGYSALMLAAIYGNFEAAELLCNDRRTDMTLRDPEQKDALMLAYEHEHPVIVDLLLRYADVNDTREHDNERACHNRIVSCLTETLCGFLQKRTSRPDSIPLIDRRTNRQAAELFP
jgi:ankyrin repeat protein